MGPRVINFETSLGSSLVKGSGVGVNVCVGINVGIAVGETGTAVMVDVSVGMFDAGFSVGEQPIKNNTIEITTNIRFFILNCLRIFSPETQPAFSAQFVS